MSNLDYKYNKKLLLFAKTLRNEMTYEEKKLWYRILKNLPYKFLRQKIIGKYIVDFYYAKLNLVIEVDGSQHYTVEKRKYDEERTEYLSQYGLKVIRISNRMINQKLPEVYDYLQYIIKNIEKKKEVPK